MKNEDVKNEFQDLSTYINLGIKDYSKKQLSYPKWLNNNHYLAYDEQSIYLVDKLHLTFITDYTSNHFNTLNGYKMNQDNTYELEEFISFKKASSTRVDFTHNYLIVVSGMTYGNILFNHSNVTNRAQIELTNQFLYTQSGFDIISNLNKISQSLKLAFKNVSRYELARDSTTDMYKDYSMIYWQSDFCPVEVHEAHNSKPIYSNYGRLTYNPIITDANNKSSGTAYIGKPQSAIQVKVYSKTIELNGLVKRKNYISQIHKKHFGTSNKITRVEARINSSTVNKLNLDLFDLLNPELHLELFYELVDNKLTFKNLLTKTWDRNNNDKYEKVKLLPSRNKNESVKQIVTQLQPVKIHNSHVNHFKTNVHSFLDGITNCFAIHGFIEAALFDNDISQIESEIIFSKIYSKYQNPINKDIIKKQKFISDLVGSKGRKWKMFKSYWQYLF